MHEKLAVVTALALGLNMASAADAPRFGQPITPADLAPWDISIGPDGVGLPPGSGTPAQGARSMPSADARTATLRRAAADRAAHWSAVVRSTALTAIRQS
jgi:hypothetical protein